MVTPSPRQRRVRSWLETWGLQPDGALRTTPSSWLLPVRHDGAPAMLKVARTADEAAGYRLMTWWGGDGAARVHACGEGALLMERATGGRDLAEMSRSGDDDLACRILCQTASRLHAGRAGEPPALHPLEAWFAPLFQHAPAHPSLAAAAEHARSLLATQQDVRPLHGDLHHGNVLDFGPRGWLAIDPHGLLGESTFDYANIFTNPDLGDPARPVATLPGRFEARLRAVTAAAGLEPERLLQWIVAWTGLSAAWFLDDEDEEGVAIDLAINATALKMLA